MQQPDSIFDVHETRRIHEIAAIQVGCNDSILYEHYLFGKVYLSKIADDGEILREDIIREMIVATGNRLSLKIWFLLKQYSKVPFDEMTQELENTLVTDLLHGSTRWR